MKVLMISLDKGLLGKGQLGDVVERHRNYGEYVEKLDIIVFSRASFEINKISEKVSAYPTNSRNRYFYLFDAYRIGKNLFMRNDYQLVITQAPFISGLVGYLLAKKFKAKLLIHFHGDYIKNKEWLKERWYNFLFIPLSIFLAKKADGIRVMSNRIKEKLIKKGVAQDKIKVISTPISLIKFGNWDNNKIEQLKIKYQGKKLLLFVGRLEKIKNLPVLLKALLEIKKNYQNFILLVIGSGSLEEEWQQLVENVNLKKNIIFIGQIDHEELVNYYQLCEFLVNSSDSESFGKVLVEAAACGKPSIATATAGAKDIILDGQTGFLVPVKDSLALAQKILYLLKNPEITKKMGEEAERIVWQKFETQKNIENIIDFWRELIVK